MAGEGFGNWEILMEPKWPSNFIIIWDWGSIELYEQIRFCPSQLEEGIILTGDPTTLLPSQEHQHQTISVKSASFFAMRLQRVAGNYRVVDVVSAPRSCGTKPKSNSPLTSHLAIIELSSIIYVHYPSGDVPRQQSSKWYFSIRFLHRDAEAFQVPSLTQP